MNQQVLDELLALKERDLATRSRLLQEGRLYGEYAEEMQQVHRGNAERLDEIVTEHGWPGIGLVGLEGCRAAWLIAQHSICTPDRQRKFLALLTAAVARGDAPAQQAAYLADRIRFNEGKAQIYGTVLDWNDQGELTCTVEDPESVDKRRRELGLPPLAEYLEAQRKAADAEGAQPPGDRDAYTRKRDEWARRVGWL
ncbi:MAG TPA: DUF6624 domain-containing protein [Burkholderiales bacterium]|nr:DUF6624 domain-containing protein [Burkholderiales bacterium]